MQNNLPLNFDKGCRYYKEVPWVFHLSVVECIIFFIVSILYVHFLEFMIFDTGSPVSQALLSLTM